MLKISGLSLLLLTTSSLAFAAPVGTNPRQAPVPLKVAGSSQQPISVPTQPCPPAPVCAPAPTCAPAPVCAPCAPCQTCDYKSNFSGFYIGGQAGLGMTRHNNKFSFNNGTRGHNPMGTRGSLVGIHAGWGKQFCSNLYLGLEIYGNTYNNSTKSVPGDNTILKGKRQNSFGIAPRLGYVVNSSLLYLRLGIDGTRFKYNETSYVTNDVQSSSKRFVGLAPGLGISQMLNDEFILGLEGSFGFFKKSHVRNFNREPGEFINNKIQNRSFDILFRLSYLFGDQKKKADLMPDCAFTGFFAGAQAGYAYTITDYPCVGVTSRVRSFDRHNTQGAIGGLHLGYGYQFKNRMYLGLEATGNLLSNKATNDSGNGADFYKHKVTNSWGINPRVGYVTPGCALIYAKIGAEFTRWNHSIDHNVEGLRFSKTKYEPGIAPGLGFAVLLNPHLIVGLEGSYIIYTNEPKVRNLRDTDHDYRDRAANLNLRVSYKF